MSDELTEADVDALLSATEIAMGLYASDKPVLLPQTMVRRLVAEIRRLRAELAEAKDEIEWLKPMSDTDGL
jgi:hypothetical protein